MPVRVNWNRKTAGVGIGASWAGSGTAAAREARQPATMQRGTLTLGGVIIYFCLDLRF
jgi:hypothetical protein